jgi:hypothetical protein
MYQIGAKNTMTTKAIARLDCVNRLNYIIAKSTDAIQILCGNWNGTVDFEAEQILTEALLLKENLRTLAEVSASTQQTFTTSGAAHG